jgi:hypothetical protein
MIFLGLDFGQILWFGDVDQGFKITTEYSYKVTISSEELTLSKFRIG